MKINTLSSFSIVNAGRGYSSAPTLTLTYLATDSTTKTNDTATVTLTNGQVTAISTPTITDISSVTNVVISSPGNAVTASATANLTSGVVTSISITVDGSSYLGLSPTVSVSANTDATGALLLESLTGEINYLINEDYNLATQARDYADNATYESDAGFGTTSTADDILDFTERNPFGEIDEGF